MGRKIIELIVSDLSGDEMEAGKGETVSFSYKGVDYSIDLTDKEAAGFDKAVSMYIEHATKTGGRAKRGTGGGASSNKEELAKMREWLRANGHDVSDRGRIAQDLQDKYRAANG